MGRAEAYVALGEYDKALADYRFISGTTEDMPYTRALSYIGQAEVHEKMEQPARAVSDYGLAKALLKASDAGKAENVSEEDVSAKLVQVLYVHAALCETLKNYNTALEDYNDLLELGENAAAKRDEVLSQLGETAEDENGLTDTEEPAAESTAEEPAEEPTEESAPGQEAASESTASSASTASGEAASSSSASSETPAESKEEQPVVQGPVTLKASERIEPYEQELGWGTFMEQVDANWTITYQIGGNTVKMYWTRMFKANGTPYLKTESTVVYTLSAPVQSAEVGSMGSDPYYWDGAVVLTVPAGTKITEKYSGVDTVLATIKGAVEYEEGISSGSGTTFGAAKFSDNTSLVEMKGRYLDECGYPDEYSSLTVQSGTKYWMGYVELDDWGADIGNIIFRAN